MSRVPTSMISALLLGCTPQTHISSAGNAGGAGGSGAGGTSGAGATGGTGGAGGQSGAGGSFNFDPHDGGPATNGDGGESSCGLQKYQLMRRPAELMLILDRSGSMQEPAGPLALNSKWVEATAALDETIMKTADRISWGLKMFPSFGCPGVVIP
jgi:hypothetical protein